MAALFLAAGVEFGWLSGQQLAAAPGFAGCGSSLPDEFKFKSGERGHDRNRGGAHRCTDADPFA